MPQDVITESSEVAAALALREPVCVSVRTGETAGVYAQLVEAAMAPERFIPLTPTLEVRNLRSTGSRPRNDIGYGHVCFSILVSNAIRRCFSTLP